MKFCPKCRSKYTDDTLKFCLQDGTSLVSDLNAGTELPTASFGKNHEQFGDKTERFTGGEITEQFITPEPGAAFATNKDLDQMRIDLPAADPNSWEQSRETREKISYQPPAPKSNTLIAVLATALAMLLIFGIAGAGAWIYFSSRQNAAAENTDKQTIGENDSNENIKEKSPQPVAEKKDSAPPPPQASPTAAETPAATFNPEEVKKEITGVIHSWKSASESLNLDAHMSRYADTIDYYTKNNVGKNFVRSDKLKAYTQYDEIEINLSNMRISLDDRGENATAVFDKAWHFESAEKTSEGKVQSQLKLRKTGGEWKITSEKDLRVYFVK